MGKGGVFAQLRLIYYHWGGIVCYALFSLFHVVVWAVQFVTWKLSGVQKQWEDACRGKCYEKSAHVLKVLASYKPTDLDKLRDLWHFFTIHESFQHPDVVLADDVMLIDVTYTKAVFAQMRSTVDKYGPETFPLLFIGLNKEVLKLIELPLDTFHRLAKKVGKPTKHYEQVTFLFHMGRCGSTLLTRMYAEADPEAVVYSEPTVFFEIYGYSNLAPRQFYLDVLKSSIYLFLKPVAKKKRAFVRNVFFVSHIAKDFQALLPDARYIYMYRDPIGVIKSHERAFGVSPFFFGLYIFMYLARMWPLSSQLALGINRNPLTEHASNSCLGSSIFEFATLFWAHFWCSYKEQAELFDYPAIYYNSLFQDRVAFCQNFLKLVRLPEDRLDAALSILDTDPQDGYVIGSKFLKDVPVTKPNEQLKERIEKFLKKADLPMLAWT